MSLDLDLRHRDTGDVLWSRNITHNLHSMAEAAGVYEAVWRPEDFDGIPARILPLVAAGVGELLGNRSRFELYNAPNRWGMYEHFVPFLVDYALALSNYPDAVAEASR